LLPLLLLPLLPLVLLPLLLLPLPPLAPLRSPPLPVQRGRPAPRACAAARLASSEMHPSEMQLSSMAGPLRATRERPGEWRPAWTCARPSARARVVGSGGRAQLFASDASSFGRSVRMFVRFVLVMNLSRSITSG
jgi:hypothetical protein